MDQGLDVPIGVTISILIIGPVGRWRGVEARLKVLMMTMRPPQQTSIDERSDVGP
jgi:hypothetical protein